MQPTSTHVNSDDICVSSMYWISVAYLFVSNVCSFSMLVSNGTVKSMILITLARCIRHIPSYLFTYLLTYFNNIIVNVFFIVG